MRPQRELRYDNILFFMALHVVSQAENLVSLSLTAPTGKPGNSTAVILQPSTRYTQTAPSVSRVLQYI